MTVVMDGHILVDEHGIARISGSRVKVSHLVMEKIANRWTDEQLALNFPSLTLAQIYAALAFYHDHRQELDLQIQQSFNTAEEARATAREPKLIERLRAEGKLK